MLVERWVTGKCGAVTLVSFYCSVSGQPTSNSGFRHEPYAVEVLSG